MSSPVVGVTILMTVTVVAGGYAYEMFNSTAEEIKGISDVSELVNQIQEYQEQNYNLESDQINQDDLVKTTDMAELPI